MSVIETHDGQRFIFVKADWPSPELTPNAGVIVAFEASGPVAGKIKVVSPFVADGQRIPGQVDARSGKILAYSDDARGGVIQSTSGRTHYFPKDEWKSPEMRLQAGMPVTSKKRKLAMFTVTRPLPRQNRLYRSIFQIRH